MPIVHVAIKDTARRPLTYTNPTLYEPHQHGKELNAQCQAQAIFGSIM